MRSSLAWTVALALLGAAACSESDATKAKETADAGGGGQDGAVDDLVVSLASGDVQGDMAGEARRFLRIPYAKPPLGELRWRAPQPNDPWKGVLHETTFVDSCPQLADQGSPASNNEDCLYLNVWAPHPAPSKAPVMVWIHGGGNFSGGAGIPIPAVKDSLWFDAARVLRSSGPRRRG